MATFSERLRAAMQNKGYKQSDLAKLTNLDKSLISNYLSGKYKARQDNLYLLAKVLGVSEAWLMGYEDKTEIFKTNQIDLTNHERAVIKAYRDNPAMQPAVDRLLGVAPEAPSEAPTVAEDIAATLSAAMEKSRVKK